LFLEQETRDTDWDASGRQEPEQVTIPPKVRVSSNAKAESLSNHLQPITEEVYEYRCESPNMQGDVERQTRIGPTQKPRDQCQVRRARDRQEFGEALDNAQNDCLQERHE
jgi:hypothetical protein